MVCDGKTNGQTDRRTDGRMDGKLTYRGGCPTSNNIVEPLYDSTTGTYVFEDELTSEKLFNHHMENEKQGKTYDSTFKNNIQNKLKSVAQADFTLSSDTFFCDMHMQDAINQTSKNSPSSPDRITLNLFLM